MNISILGFGKTGDEEPDGHSTVKPRSVECCSGGPLTSTQDLWT